MHSGKWDSEFIISGGEGKVPRQVGPLTFES